MEDYGFDTVYLQEVMVPHWERGELEEAYFYNGKNKINLSILGAGGTVSTPKEGITAEVVEVSSLDEVMNWEEKMLRGKLFSTTKRSIKGILIKGASYGQTGFQKKIRCCKSG